MSASAAEKMIRLIVDNPGFLIGSQAEKEGTARVGARALIAVYQATVPWVSILLRRVFGAAGAEHGNAESLNLRYAWPSGDWGSLPIEGGVQAAYRREIEAAPDPDARIDGPSKSAWSPTVLPCEWPKRLGSKKSSTLAIPARSSATGQG